MARRLMLGAAMGALMSPAAGLAKDSTYKDMYDFTGNNDQVTPYGEFVQAPNGKLYGALFINDSMIYQTNGGAFIKVDWSSGDDGDVCGYGMTVGMDGALYGTCTEWQYNANSSGIIFRFDPDTNGFTVLYSFPAFNNGGSENLSPLTLGPDGNFYGTTRGDDVNVYGTVFQVTPSGQLTTIYAFTDRHGDGATPSSGGTYVGNAIPLTLGSDGNLYGTTDGGGDHGSGTVYRITPSGTVTILYSMTRNTPCSCTGVTEANGNLYGQTHWGGPQNEGTIFQLAPDGTFTTLHKFNAAKDSAEYPELPLTLGSDGNLYGASPSFTGGYGPESLYRITPAGKYTDLYNKFALPPDADCDNGLVGCFENAPLYQATDGYYYGVTLFGGANSKGSMFRLKVRGTAPFVRPLLPVAKPGQWLGIEGQGFKHATGVSFGSQRAAFRVVSDTYLEAKMPPDAAKGKIAVTLPNGELHSNIEVAPLH
jgi:uncharacterized repeat protein (TIGR03803 family)